MVLLERYFTVEKNNKNHHLLISRNILELII